MRAKQWEVVDVFCGIGGLTRGLLDAGLRVTAGFDIDESCRYAYEHNGVKFIQNDVQQLSYPSVSACYGKNAHRILVGCAPCQPFSRYARNGHAEEWAALPEFLRLIRATSPEIVSMENVPGLCRRAVFNAFVDDLLEMRYHVSYSIADSSDYGVPQHRKRLILLASRVGPISLLSGTDLGTHRATVRDAIGHLPAIRAGERSASDPLHAAAPLSPKNLARIQASVPGGTWRDWPASLRLQCQTERSTYPSVYGRMQWDEPAPTMTTQFFGYGNGRFGHPEQDRALSLREGALLQSFPPDYEFAPDHSVCPRKVLGRHIGNAVPPKLARAIGLSILDHIAKEGAQ